MNPKQIGFKIKQLRNKKSIELGTKYTGDMLANEIGISRSYLGDIESGRTKPKIEVLQNIANILGVSIDYFYQDNEANAVIEESSGYATPQTKDEDNLINNFRKLNKLGKTEAIKRINELTFIKKYVESDYLKPLAAHSKDGDFTKEEIQHDLDIMDNDDFWTE